MNRDNHYEAAFAHFLRERGVGYVAVNEASRSLIGEADVKSADFIVVGPADARLVVDVKGRKFPGGSDAKPRKVWQNWSTEEDVIGLIRWSAALGNGFRGVLAFVYQIRPPFAVPPTTPDLFEFRGHSYLIRGIDVNAYRVSMKPRSRAWGTVYLPTAEFRTLVRPFTSFLTARPSPVPVTS
jgi:hypothetical protein